MIWSVRDMATINYPDPPQTRFARRSDLAFSTYLTRSQPRMSFVAPLLPAKRRRRSFYNTGSLCFESYPLLLEGVGKALAY